jgi:tRNA (guanine37-N1)-methyltransferase
MRFDVVTLFPELFEAQPLHGVTRRAYDSGALQVKPWQLRNFADDAYRRVDDRPYGGGPGMVMLAEPLQRALAAVRVDRADAEPVPVVHFSPAGRRLDQTQVQAFAAGRGAVLLCARYEGVDQRFIDQHVTHEVSLGDFVLSGGEWPALALLDAVARLLPGVLPELSHQQESFSDGLLEGPQYTRPEVLPSPDGPLAVPAVLLSGHHADVRRWRRERALEFTARRRPDLIDAARVAGRLDAADEHFLRGLQL